MKQSSQTEKHPLQPFLPQGAEMLMLGSFPPPKQRWSMEFFYPNWINDMWRIMGLIFFGDKHHFEIPNTKAFDSVRIAKFCNTQHIALYDAATMVRRAKDNASDKFLEVVEQTNIAYLLDQLPLCTTIVTTGQKATEITAEQFGATIPAVGEYTYIYYKHRTLRLFRMPSSSRAYPLSIDKKAEQYRKVFINL